MRFVGANRNSATLAGIAAAAGVSRMTVSLTLRNRPGVGAATRARILALAQELGYRANPLVSAYQSHIRSRRTRGYHANLAWVTDRPLVERGRVESGVAPYWDGAFAAAGAAGFKLEAFRVTGGGVAALQRMLRARGIHGVILSWLEDPGVAAADWEDFSVGVIGNAAGPAACYHGAAPDTFHNVQLALGELRKEGAARIGLVLTEREDACTAGAERGAFSLAQVPPGTALPACVQADFEGTAGRKALQEWLDCHRPDGLLLRASSAELLAQLAPSVRLVPLDAGTAPAAGGLDPQAQAIAAAAIELVTKQLQQNVQGRPRTPHTICIRGQWRSAALSGPTPISVPGFVAVAAEPRCA